jgi:acetolactate synthase I/III small subunit
LESGITKAVLSAFVADEAGIINRVAGVFARRGANIESLAVGLNIDKALFTIVVAGSRSTVANLVKQTAKLVKVRYVEDISRSPRVERELVLFKVAAPSSAGSLRAEVLQLADIFRARVVDVGPECVTLCCTGDAGKSAALQRALESTSGGMNSKNGNGKSIVREIARTGRVALKRGPALLEMGGWGDSGAPAPSASAAAAAAKSRGEREGDGVYGSGESGSGNGNNADLDNSSDLENEALADAVLDAPRYSELGDPDCDAATLSILVADVPGVLNQVTGVLARRGVNVQSLAVGPAEDVFVQSCPQSRITVVIPGTNDGSTPKIVKQLEKLVYVSRVEDLSEIPYVSRELMLVKVRAPTEARRRLTDLAAIFRGSVCDVSAQTLTIELVGKEDKMRALLALLEPFGVLEVARTGRVALARDSGVDTRQLDRSKSERRVML